PTCEPFSGFIRLGFAEPVIGRTRWLSPSCKLEEAIEHRRCQPHAEHDQHEIAEDAEAAQFFRLRIEKSVADDPVRAIAKRKGNQKNKDDCHRLPRCRSLRPQSECTFDGMYPECAGSKTNAELGCFASLTLPNGLTDAVHAVGWVEPCETHHFDLAAA